MSKKHPLLATVDALLQQAPTPWATILERVLAHFDCVVGTVHLLGEDGVLHLEAQRGLPPPVLEKVQLVPIGKGMAGLAAERREPVQVCNLQSDTSGKARPGAKLTQMEGSLAAPMLADGELAGVFGIAKPVPYEFPAAEQQLLMEIGAAIARARR
ncbi:MAG: GAF domain-containing protein [Planctomycetota bacterium]